MEIAQLLWVPVLGFHTFLEKKVRNFFNTSSHSKHAPDVQVYAGSLYLQRGKGMEEKMTFFFLNP